MNWQQQITAMPVEEARELAEVIVLHAHPEIGGGEETFEISCDKLLSLIKAHDIAVTEKKIAREAHLITLGEATELQARIDHLPADQQTKTWLLSRRGKLIRKLGRKISSMVRGNKS